ncbi:hypothetical protein FKM82_021566 [Ascaphus truei]
MTPTRHTLSPLPANYLQPDKRSLTVCLYQGSVTEKDPALLGFELITCIELVEHLEEAELKTFPDTVLGFMAPGMVVISTPNVEFNPLLPGCTSFRHHDHKFEWSREQFQSWATDSAGRYNYTVEFSGVGGVPAGAKEVGFCTQIGVFTRNYRESEESIKRKMEAKRVYKTVFHVVYPSLQEEKYFQRAVINEALYYAHCMKIKLMRNLCSEDVEPESHLPETEQKPNATWSGFSKPYTPPQTEGDTTIEPFIQGDNIYIPLQRLFSIPSVMELCGSVDVLRKMVTGKAELSSDGSAVIFPVDLENDSEFS